MLAKSLRMLSVAVMVFGCLFVLQGQNSTDGANWPSFRGPNASGIAEKYATPVSWDVETSKNINYSTQSPLKTVQVKALPEAGKPLDFKGAVGKFDFRVTLNKE